LGSSVDDRNPERAEGGKGKETIDNVDGGRFTIVICIGKTTKE
jgi:hypothetical protein